VSSSSTSYLPYMPNSFFGAGRAQASQSLDELVDLYLSDPTADHDQLKWWWLARRLALDGVAELPANV
jgi:hypothetical protein